MSERPTPKGPKTQRFLIGLFTIILTLLFIFAIGFVVGDIGQIPGPDYQEIRDRFVTPDLSDRRNELQRSLRDVETRIENQRETQAILETSTRNSQQTMNQLLENNRLNIERNQTPTEEEKDVLAESQARFLDNQRKFQEANESIAQMSEQKRDLEAQQTDLSDRITPLETEAEEEFRRQYDRHSLMTAAIKLSVLLPIFFLATWQLKIRRGTTYAPLFIAFFIASFVQTASVIHEYFPSRYFKYIAVAAAIAVTIAILRFLLRRLAKPDRGWLLEQFREAYQKHRCPVCSYPIERGVFRQALWTAKGPVAPSGQSTEGVAERAYTCPSCGSPLFEKCDRCETIRHSLLPYCEGCGVEKAIGG